MTAVVPDSGKSVSKGKEPGKEPETPGGGDSARLTHISPEVTARERETEDDLEDEEDEDELLDRFAAAFERRLNGNTSLQGPRGGPAETSGRPSAAAAGDNYLKPLAETDKEWFVLLDENDPDLDERTLEASIEKIMWRPATGLPIDEHDRAGLPLGKAESVDQSGSTKGLKVPSKGQMVKGGKSKGSGKELRLEAGLEKKLLAPPRDPRKEARAARKAAPQTAGSKWYDLPATQITPEMKTELRLLKLRAVLDPKRHYKAPDSSKFPKHFQIGTVVESAADFFSGRLTRKERKPTFGAELLADPALKHYRKRKFEEIQAERDLGSRRHFKKKMDKKKPAWARG